MTAPIPRRGAMYDCGGAYAIYWPDQHPCGNNRPEPWLILHDVGHIEWVAELSQGRHVSYLPGFADHESICAKCGLRGHTSRWCTNEAEPTS